MTETTFQHVSNSKLSFTSFMLPMVPVCLPVVPLAPLALPMVPLASLAIDTVQGYMVAMTTNDKITNGTPGRTSNVLNLRLSTNEVGK